MIVKLNLIKNVFLMFSVLVISISVFGCGKPGSFTNWYPEAETLEGLKSLNVPHEVIKDKTDQNKTAVIEDRSNFSSGRWWIDVKCDYWAGCFMRCDGPKKQCKKLAEDSNLTVNSISPF
jgi:hypothetical protein